MIEKISSNVHRITARENLPLLIVSDIHFDSLHCDHESLKKHFDQIKEKNGKIFIVGDLFDVMGCHKDPRSTPSQINPIYIQKGRSYLDLVVEDCYEFLKPYKENLALISYGNHEMSILKHRDTDPLERIIFLLNQTAGTVCKGSYAGWLICSLERSGGISNRIFNIAYHHGKGGGAQRSKGILYSQLDTMEFPDANMIVSGHDHNKLYDPSNVRKRMDSATGKTYKDTVHWLKTGSYAKSPEDFGWVVEKGFMGKRMGGWFVDLQYIRDTTGGKDVAYIEPTVYEAIPVRS